MSKIKIFQAKHNTKSLGSAYDVPALEKEVNEWLGWNHVHKVESTEFNGKPTFWVWYE